MYGSSGWLLFDGDTIGRPPGEFQLLAVAGDVAGESSLFMLRLVELKAPGGGGAPIGSIPPGCFFRCARCFSSMLSKPSFVKGFGSTSFMPAIHVSDQFSLSILANSALTMLEVHRDVVAPNVRCHRHNRSVVKLPYQVRS